MTEILDAETLDAKQHERLVLIWQRCCAALQTVVTDLKITQDELKLAGQYLNRLGQSGMSPNLLAVGLAMTSMRATEAAAGTPPSLEGPYYVRDAPLRKDGVLWEKPPGPESRRLELSGVVRDAATGRALDKVEIDLWQADEWGIYDHRGFHLRGRVLTDAEGRYRVHTLVPKDYAEHDHDPIGELFRAMRRHNRRAAHIHLKIRRSGYRTLTTQLFMPDGAYLGDDYVEGAVVPELIVKFAEPPADGGRVAATFDFALVPDEAPRS